MHRVFLFLALLITGCASTKLEQDDAVLSAYTSGLIDGATAAHHSHPKRPTPCGQSEK
jgi:hypothetical protein